MSATTIVLKPRHVVVEQHLHTRGWTRARQLVDDDIALRHNVNRILRDLELLGILEVRLVGGGFCEWRHLDSEVT